MNSRETIPSAESLCFLRAVEPCISPSLPPSSFPNPTIQLPDIAGTMNANFPGFRKGVMPGHALVGVKLTAITVRTEDIAYLLTSFLPCFLASFLPFLSSPPPHPSLALPASLSVFVALSLSLNGGILPLNVFPFFPWSSPTSLVTCMNRCSGQATSPFHSAVSDLY